MKKIIAATLSMLLVLSFAAFGYAAAPSDVQGTKYEAAVQSLMDMEILTGYSDGTFRPESTVSRAEMAAIIVRTLNKSSFGALQAPSFKDIEGHWAKDYITIVYSLEIVNGITQDLFAPESKVTYAQAAAMMIRALGYSDAEVSGAWPQNYINKGMQLGLFDDVDVEGKAASFATRGDVALMMQTIAQEIRLHWQEPVEEEPVQDNGKLATFSGKAIGLPLGLAWELNSEDDVVEELEFLMGEKTYYFNTEEFGVVTADDYKKDGRYTGGLYAARLHNGILKSILPAEDAGLERYVELTAHELEAGKFLEITQNRSERLTVSGVLASFGYADELTCYEAVFDGNQLETFQSVSVSSMQAGDYVRAWDLDEDWAGFAVVVVLIDQDDVAAAREYGIII